MKRIRVSDFNKDTSKMKNYSMIFRKYYNIKLSRSGENANNISLARSSLFFESMTQIAIDPFARNCEWAYPYTNDINPDTKACYNMDALDFIQKYTPGSFSIGLLDPPFSSRMEKDKYGTSNLYAADSKHMRAIELALGNVIETSGYIIKLGYNSSKPHPSFTFVDAELWNMGACRNDIICSIWKKTNSSVGEWV